ncbi:phosphonate ABC transporter ATP-binding protein [Leptolyngbya cf. ectocarpi LEGE 11479]|uniref:Phosphonate ABC transporter ATP-binding protein n=1 Tax=Leptolyngbya cf. ectocarpi LEGE 11479 TaxID=1828722 RepID=A0A928ZUY4_LEPEC|nr:phosphonate ABC transporter ATP-binding protein [Leptolyngbya ectocarpi]MBE9067860.1 phosphonate ABC transporter ATP-binding protein [Leptolyngbya cf. ectocarpi LEGE 11479]
MPKPPEATIVGLQNVGVTYSNGVTALHSISLKLYRGEFAGVLGVSGAGKSTLLRTINHLQRPTQGTIVADGLGELADPRVLRAHRQRTGMIFQQHQLIERQSALQNVLMGRLAYHSFWRSLRPLPHTDQRLALDCLERVGLIDKALIPVKALSGGQKQRVGIARALAQQPQLILADEPIASLDPTSAHQVMALLRMICKTGGITALLSLHQVGFAREYCDRIIGLAQGHIIFDGPPSKLDAHTLEKIYTNRSVRAV